MYRRTLLRLSWGKPRTKADRFLPFADRPQEMARRDTLVKKVLTTPLLAYAFFMMGMGLYLYDKFVLGHVDTFRRVCKVAWHAHTVTLYYRWMGLFAESPLDQVVTLCRCHEVAAHKTLDLFLDLGGIYVKIGQTISAMTQTMPLEWCIVMKACLDHARTMSAADVLFVFRRSYEDGGLAGAPSDFFNEFHDIPEKAASLAQVHTARHKTTGDKLAVKVQYKNIPAMMKTDVFIMRFLLRIVGSDLNCDLSWLPVYFQETIEKELDFESEARNCQRFGSMFDDWEDVRSPSVDTTTSCRTILTMEYVDGFNLDSKAAIEAHGFDPSELTQRVSEVIASSIFDHGFLHGDPHPANIFVEPAAALRPSLPVEKQAEKVETSTWGRMFTAVFRPKEEATSGLEDRKKAITKAKDGQAWRLAWLDHGLYQEIDPETRRSYARLWAGVGLEDTEMVQSACKALGVSNWKLLASILGSKAERRIEGVASDQLMGRKDFFIPHVASTNMALGMLELMGSMPKNLIVALKCNALLYSVQRELHVPITYHRVMALAGIDHLAQTALAQANTPKERAEILKKCELQRATVMANMG
ncbi:putative serine/threonine-protein kinase abkD [Diplonema papillatum]|nr:putative serine/threonine-protein kinase abkD [Diplonema papillatum]